MEIKVKSTSKENLHPLLIILAFAFAQLFISANMINPVRFAYMGQYGVDIKMIGYLKFAFLGTIFLFEIPTGFIADYFGKKTSLILAGLCSAAHYLVYVYYPCLTGFLLAQVFLGLSQTFTSGADSAYLKEYLNEKGIDNHHYLLLRSRISAISKVGVIVLTAISGPLYERSQYSVFLFSILGSGIACCLIALLPRLQIEKNRKWSRQFSRILGNFQTTVVTNWRYFFSHSGLVKIAIVDAILLTSVVYIFEAYQFRFQDFGIGAWSFGYIYAGCNIIGIFGAFLVSKIRKWMGTPMSDGFVASIFIILSISVYLFAHTTHLFIFFASIAAQQLIYGIWLLVIDNKTVEVSEGIQEKSTFLSLYSLAVGILRSILVLGISGLLYFASFQTFSTIISIFLVIGSVFFARQRTHPNRS